MGFPILPHGREDRHDLLTSLEPGHSRPNALNSADELVSLAEVLSENTHLPGMPFSYHSMSRGRLLVPSIHVQIAPTNTRDVHFKDGIRFINQYRLRLFLNNNIEWPFIDHCLHGCCAHDGIL